MKLFMPRLALLFAFFWLLVAVTATSTTSLVLAAPSEGLQDLPIVISAAASIAMSDYITKTEHDAAMEAQRLYFEQLFEKKLTRRASDVEKAFKKATNNAITFFRVIGSLGVLAGVVGLGFTISNFFEPRKTATEKEKEKEQEPQQQPKKLGIKAKRKAARSSEIRVEEGR
ncbi:hypothetical protein E8E11_003767 [Didymella keratinophila]|nr:hypothetical protein E8E11_003767 [Didymella keratinophila]